MVYGMLGCCNPLFHLREIGGRRSAVLAESHRKTVSVESPGSRRGNQDAPCIATSPGSRISLAPLVVGVVFDCTVCTSDGEPCSGSREVELFLDNGAARGPGNGAGEGVDGRRRDRNRPPYRTVQGCRAGRSREGHII